MTYDFFSSPSHWLMNGGPGNNNMKITKQGRIYALMPLVQLVNEHAKTSVRAMELSINARIAHSMVTLYE